MEYTWPILHQPETTASSSTIALFPKIDVGGGQFPPYLLIISDITRLVDATQQISTPV
jgi:hypothetical protein